MLHEASSLNAPGAVQDVGGGRQERQVQSDDITLLQQFFFGYIGNAQGLNSRALVQVMCQDPGPKPLHRSRTDGSVMRASVQACEHAFAAHAATVGKSMFQTPCIDCGQQNMLTTCYDQK